MSTIFEQTDRALRDLQLAYFAQRHPDVVPNMATEHVLQEAIEEYGLPFTVDSFDFVVKEHPELLQQMCPAPTSVPKENAAQAEENLRKRLAEEILKATREHFNENLTVAQRQQKLEDLSRHFKYWTTQQLQQKLTDLENQTRYEALNFEELKRTTRAEYAQRHNPALAGQTFEPLPPGLDSKTLKKMIYTMPKEQYEPFKRKHGIDAINARLAGGQ